MKKEDESPVIQPDKIQLSEVVVLKSTVNGEDHYLKRPSKPEKVELGVSAVPKFDLSQNQCHFRLQILLSGHNTEGIPIGFNADFLFDFHFIVENMADFAVLQKGETKIRPILGATLMGICFSTARGMVIERTKGTPFAGFILPVINPSKVLFESLRDAQDSTKNELIPGKTPRKQSQKRT